MDYRVSSLSQQWEEATPLLKAIISFDTESFGWNSAEYRADAHATV
jgi:hypothetical protein